MACVLVVDDESINLEIIAEFLGDLSLDLAMAQDGQEAWEKLDARPEGFDAVILDRIMPRLGGMELLRRLKADVRFANLPVIMQTAAAERDQVAEGLAAGAWFYLAKPFSENALQGIVRAALYDRRNRLELARLSAEWLRLLGLMEQACFRFRSPEQARTLAVGLARHCPAGDAVAMGLAELMVNAVEHGNLGIGYAEKTCLMENGIWQEEIERRLASPEQAERWAQVEFTREADRLRFTVSDQGNGFDWQNYLELDPARVFDNHGRGIAMARAFAFVSLEYRGKGNVVIATVAAESGHV